MAIESTLRALADAMAEHRRSLADHGQTAGAAPPVPPPPSARAAPAATTATTTTTTGPAPPVAPRPARTTGAAPSGPLHAVMLRACAHYGIAVGETVEAKLRRILGAAEGKAVERWVAMLMDLPHDHPEWLALAESLTVHETYVWRDGNQLSHLREAVMPGLIAAVQASGARRLRLLSAGCSTGEEAYTLALIALDALLAAGLASEKAGDLRLAPGWQVEVLGVDLSRIAVRQAENAIYDTGELSAFRDTPKWVERFFPQGPSPGTRTVRADVRRAVRFKQWNLVQDESPWDAYHVVACRNLLIYLTPEARTTVYGALARGLVANGVMLVGPTDLPQGPVSFKPDWGKGTVVWRRAEARG